MDKSPDAFRTISEVAEWLDIPTHVLRFWESRFAQIKPVKRAGGRRYYRPSDMRLIGGVKTLLHDQGMTIRGVQKMLREHGIKHVSSFSQPLDTDLDDTAAETVIEHEPTSATPAPAARQTYAAEPAPVPEEASSDDQPELFPASDEPDDPLPMPTFVPSRTRSEPAPASPAPVAAATEPEPEPEPAPTAPQIPATPDVPDTDPSDEDPAYPSVPGIAARLAALPTSQLAAHNDVLTQARDRLVALRDAQS